MGSASEILVIILSVFLAFFLVLGIVLTVYLIKLTRQIRNVASSAEKTVGNLESVVSNITKAISPIFVAEMIGKFIKKFNNGRNKKER